MADGWAFSTLCAAVDHRVFFVADITITPIAAGKARNSPNLTEHKASAKCSPLPN